MTDTFEAYRDLKTIQQHERRDRRAEAAQCWRQLAEECEPFGIHLRRNTDSHYQLIGGGRSRWIVDIYPGNCRIRTSGLWPYGYLNLANLEWTLADVVEAVAAKMGVAHA